MKSLDLDAPFLDYTPKLGSGIEDKSKTEENQRGYLFRNREVLTLSNSMKRSRKRDRGKVITMLFSSYLWGKKKKITYHLRTF